MLPSLLSIAVMFQLGREVGWYLTEKPSPPAPLPGGEGSSSDITRVAFSPSISDAVSSGKRLRDRVNLNRLLSLPVLAALVISLMDAENYMAQELRMYTWHVLFAACSTWAYLRFLRLSEIEQRNKPFAPIILWLLANVLLIYTHYFGAFVLLAQAGHALIFLRREIRWKALAVLFMTGLIFLPWALLVTRDQFAAEAVSLTTERIHLGDLALDLRDKWMGQQWALLLMMMGAGLFVIVQRDWQALRGDVSPHAKSFSQGKKDLLPSPSAAFGRGAGGEGGGLSLLLIALLLLPIALTIILGHNELVLLARRLVQITVPVALLIAIGIALLSPQARAVIVVALLLYGVTTVDWYRVKVPWHTITDLIAEYARPGELALADVAYEESALLYYYDHLLPDGMQISTYPVWSDMERYDYYEIMLPELLAEQPARQSDVVTAWVTFFSPDPGILHKLEAAGFQRTMTRPYNHVGSVIDVYRYDRLPEERERVRFENGMLLKAWELVPEALRVDLWWSVDARTDADYTVSAALLDESGRLVAQLDTQPQDNARPTTGIEPGEVVYDPHRLALVEGMDSLPPGDYSVIVRVYLWQPDGLIPVLTADGGQSVTLGTIRQP
jgi:hypothetical protein